MHETYYTSLPNLHSLDDLMKESTDFALIYCGKEQCSSNYCYGPNRRENYVLHIILEGKGVLETGGQVFSMGKSHAFLLFPNVEAYYRADSDHPWTYMWVGFDGVTAYETMTKAGFSETTPVQLFEDNLVADMEEHIKGMLDASQLTLSNKLKRNSYLLRLLSDLIEFNEIKTGNQPDDLQPNSMYVKHAMDYITHHFSERIRIRELADYIGVNRSYLTTSFKKILGVSPQEFLVNLRIEKASSLLQNTDIPINLIAGQVGYDDSLAFSKLFKKYMGVSPKKFRNSPSKLIVLNDNDDE